MDKKYDLVKKHLLGIIHSMEPGQKLPSERDLIEQLGYSRPTVQKAILDLEKEGFLYKINRQGTFIADRKLHKSMNRLIGFQQEVQETGAVATTHLLDYRQLPSNTAIAKKLNIQEGEPVYRTVRLRYKNGLPTVLDYSFFACFAFEGANEETLCDSVYDFIEKEKKLTIACANQIITAELPSKNVARILNLPEDRPVIRMDQTVLLADGRPFEFTVSYKNPRRYVLSVTAQR